jgi:DNA-directed RNA polymerase subunit beta
MSNLENINPTEELSCFTRIKPIGEGGVPDANAITKDARNIHESYYGNIDSMDTPEGGNVGITNQLAIGAALTNARGSFVDKNNLPDDKAGILGVNSAMVPFVGSCDGNRVMFAGSQGRQAIPINGSEQPLVQTGYESTLTHLLSDDYIKKAIDDGTIASVTDNSISIKLKTNRIQVISLEPTILRAGQGQSSLNYFRPIVKEGQRVKKNQIVAEGKHIKNGVISVGTNLLCAVMQWKGYSYEDGYIISDRVAKAKFTSSAYHEIEVLVKPNDNVHSINIQGALTKRGEHLLVRSSKEVEDIVGLSDDELQDGNIITKSPGGRIVSLEIYPNSPISKFPALKEEFSKFKQRYEEGKGTFPKNFTSKIGSDKMRFSGVLIRFKIEESQVAELGDKITNSYGGKGVIAKIEPYENMPMTPWGEHVDIILNPIAIINRMNPSTLKELYMSLISKFLAKRLAKMGTSKSDNALKLLDNVMTTIDGTKNKAYSKQYMKVIRGMSKKVYAQWIQEIVDKNYHLPLIVAPFQEPSLGDIKNAMKIVGAKESYPLMLKEFNTKTSKPIAVGWLYYKKLEQQSGIKMSARSTGLVNSQTRQAMAGGKKGGGQKIGEMDSWSIINHGATNVLREFYGPLADDHVTKDQIIADIIQSGSAEYRTPRTSPTKDLFDVYIKGMMIEPDM